MALEFKIELSGNFAGALEKDAAAAEKAEHATKKHRHELEVFEAEVGKASASVGGFGINLEALAKGGSLFTFDLAEGLREVADIATEVIEKIADLGKEMVKAAGDAQDLNLAVKLDVGEEGAKKIDELAESFKNSRFSPKQIKEGLLPLLEQGVDDPALLNDLATAATDISARRKSGIGGFNAALGAFQQIGLRREVNSRMLRELAINEHDFYADLGGLLGITSEQAKAQAEKGKLQSKTLLSVALHQIAQREGGAIGTATNEGSKTLGATLDRLRNVAENLFEGIADGPGMKAIQDALDRFIETMQGPGGQQLMADIDGLLESLGKYLTPDYIEAFTKTLIDGFRSGVNAVQSIVELLSKAKGIVDDLAKPMIALMNIGDKLTGGGGDNNDGRAAIISQEKHQLLEALNSGKITPQQFAELAAKIPAMADGGIVSRPTLALVGEAGPEAVVPLSRRTALADALGDVAAGGGGRGDINYSPSYSISGGDSSAVREQLEAFDRQARIEFKKILDEMLAA